MDHTRGSASSLDVAVRFLFLRSVGFRSGARNDGVAPFKCTNLPRSCSTTHENIPAGGIGLTASGKDSTTAERHTREHSLICLMSR